VLRARFRRHARLLFFFTRFDVSPFSVCCHALLSSQYIDVAPPPFYATYAISAQIRPLPFTPLMITLLLR